LDTGLEPFIMHLEKLYRRSHPSCTQRFSRKNADSERALFELLYATIFKLEEHAGQVWGCFFQQPLTKEQIKEWTDLSEQELKQKYFREHLLTENSCNIIIHKIKEKVKQAKNRFTIEINGFSNEEM
jgi:hypothetical protein